MKLQILQRALAAAAAALVWQPTQAQVTPTNIPSVYAEMFEYLDPFLHPSIRTRIVDVGQYWPVGLWEPFNQGAILFSAFETGIQHSLGRTTQGGPARLEMFSTNNGNTFWAEAISAHQGGSGRDVVGGQVGLIVAQTYVKESADAKLSYTFNAGSLDIGYFGSARRGTLRAAVSFSIDVLRFSPVTIPEILWNDNQYAELAWDYGDAGQNDDDLFVSAFGRGPDSNASYPSWAWRGCLRCDGAPGYGQAGMFLDEQYTQTIDLSAVRVGEEFAINFRLNASANDAVQGETWAYAFARDPLSSSGGSSFTTVGLLPTNRGYLALAPVPEPAIWALWGLGLAWLAIRRRTQTGDCAIDDGGQHRFPPWTH